MSQVANTLLDQTIRHAHLMEQLKTHEVSRMMTFINKKMLPDLEVQLSRALLKGGVSPASKRLIQIIKETRAISSAGMKSAAGTLASSLKEIGAAEASWQIAALQSSLPLNLSYTMPSVGLINEAVIRKPFMGRLLKDWFTGMNNQLVQGVQDQINIGLVSGESVPNIVRRLVGTKAAGYADGIFNATRRHVEAVTRTSINHVVTHAREATYAANESVVKAVQFVATLDGRTTETCAALDGKVFPINEGPRPPMHIRCRSTTVPITKSWKELGLDVKEMKAGTRESMNGKVPAKTTYGQWLKKQPTAVQNQVLGKGKAQLFRKGMPIEKFVGKKWEPLSLAQVKRLDKVVPPKLKPKLKPKPKPVPPKPTSDAATRIANMAMSELAKNPEALAQMTEITELEAGIRHIMALRAAKVAGKRGIRDKMNLSLLKAKRQTLTIKLGTLNREASGLKRMIHDAMRSKDFNPRRIVIKQGHGKVPKETKRKAEEAGRWLCRRISKRSSIGVKRADQFVYVARTKGRAYHQGNSINLGDFDQVRTYIHELGHALEDRFQGSKVQLQESLKFLRARTKGEMRVQLKAVKGGGYGADEMTRLDKFMEPYMGKDYGEQATEILSMALESMYDDPVGFLLRDREMFEWTLRVMGAGT